ncbi:multidrug transporter [Floccifex sp.]|uniref:multidrug transporter n=1 Tax=Floccifex sp. TaxID=2815810 RepID=UPI003F034914
MECSKQDLKIFKSKIKIWQENYMERLIQEYIKLLNEEKTASEKFWTLEEQIQKDKKKPGVFMTLRPSNMIVDIVNLIDDGVITMEDLEEFSDDVKEKVKIILR